MKKSHFLLILCLITATVHAQWIQEGDDIDGEMSADFSGWSNALSADGTTVAIGAHGNGLLEGHVRVYELIGSSWIQKGEDLDGDAAFDRTGWSVSINADGSTVAIGGPHFDGRAPQAGHVRVYEWNDTAWMRKGLDILGEASDDLSGSSVSISSDGNTVAIGAPHNDQPGTLTGSTRIYEWNEEAWVQKGNEINGLADFDRSGWSVSLSADGETVAIGAPLNDAQGTDAGYVSVYSWNGTDWMQKGTGLLGEAAEDESGTAISIDGNGNTIAIGAPFNDGIEDNAGHVRVYEWSGSEWLQKGLDIDGEAKGDESGTAVSMSLDGNTVAIGAPENDGSKPSAGHVRIFTWSGSEWIQKGSDIDGEGVNDDSGVSVTLNGDGSKVAIGAYLNDGSSLDAGHVRVYRDSATVVNVVEADFSADFSLYPNPNNGRLFIDLGSKYANSTLTTLSLEGEVIQQNEYFERQILDLELNLATGIYMIHVHAGEKKSAFKVLIEH